MKTMKQLILVVFLGLCLTSKSQVYSPQLAGWSGYNYILYPYGYYQGSIVNGIANGIGTFYFNDGSFYYGNFYGGFWDGPGVLVSRQYGYVSGCFSQGVFAGPCVNIPNPYSSSNRVKEIVSTVQTNRPSTATTPQYDPDGYQITQLDESTNLGQQVLGAYHSN